MEHSRVIEAGVMSELRTGFDPVTSASSSSIPRHCSTRFLAVSALSYRSS